MTSSERILQVKGFALIATATTLAGCSGGDATQQAAAQPVDDGATVIMEAFHTATDSLLNIDSPAVWHGPNGEHWLLSTAKEGDVIRVDDATTGTFIRDLGGPGTEPGRLERPNGIAVLDDILWVVERDNRRVQLFTLPGFRSVVTFGSDELLLPYGIAVRPDSGRSYTAWITDSYEVVEDQVPPDSALGRRIHEFRVTIGTNGARAERVRAFGETGGPGVLRVVESIAVDPAHDRLMIAEELEGESLIKVYDTGGRFTDRTMGPTSFPNQAEGIVLYACGEEAGYWIATDQGTQTNTFHVFDRVTLEPLGSFRGARVFNTDGIALTQHSMPGFPAGAFYAVHDDSGVVAFSWQNIADALNLRSDCLTRGLR
jgi:3-phytase